MSPQVGRPVSVLLAEDSQDDIELIKEALKESRIVLDIHIVTDGQMAIDYLRGDIGTNPRPDLILLDLNMPKKSGMEVLKEIKEDDNLKRIPVIILTTSKSDRDVMESYNLHANCYITKPIDFDQFIRVIKTINDFWLSIVKLPSS